MQALYSALVFFFLVIPGLPVPSSQSKLSYVHKRHQNSYIMRADKAVEGIFVRIRGARSVHREMKKNAVKHISPKRVGRSGISSPTEIGSELFGQDVIFLSPNNTELLAHQGSSVTLSCRLTKSPNFGMVTWSRRLLSEKSLQVLSIADFTHINDQRFLIAKKPQDNDWQLQIKSVTSYDSGEYQCQATTHPPSLISIMLSVVDAFAEIQVEDKSVKKSNKDHHENGNEPNEKFIKKDSQLKLNCYLRKATEKPLYIFWYHNNSMVNYSPDTGRKVVRHQDGWGSTLLITKAAAHDGGNYTCAPHNIHPDSVLVTIMDGEGKSAAVHRDEASSADSAKNSVMWFLIQLLFILKKFCEEKTCFFI